MPAISGIGADEVRLAYNNHSGSTSRPTSLVGFTGTWFISGKPLLPKGAAALMKQLCTRAIKNVVALLFPLPLRSVQFSSVQLR